jgi:hypothetical protein
MPSRFLIDTSHHLSNLRILVTSAFPSFGSSWKPELIERSSPCFRQLHLQASAHPCSSASIFSRSSFLLALLLLEASRGRHSGRGRSVRIARILRELYSFQVNLPPLGCTDSIRPSADPASSSLRLSQSVSRALLKDRNDPPNSSSSSLVQRPFIQQFPIFSSIYSYFLSLDHAITSHRLGTAAQNSTSIASPAFIARSTRSSALHPVSAATSVSGSATSRAISSPARVRSSRRPGLAASSNLLALWVSLPFYVFFPLPRLKAEAKNPFD